MRRFAAIAIFVVALAASVGAYRLRLAFDEAFVKEQPKDAGAPWLHPSLEFSYNWRMLLAIQPWRDDDGGFALYVIGTQPDGSHVDMHMVVTQEQYAWARCGFRPDTWTDGGCRD